jgi:hypothetical protein
MGKGIYTCSGCGTQLIAADHKESDSIGFQRQLHDHLTEFDAEKEKWNVKCTGGGVWTIAWPEEKE